MVKETGRTACFHLCCCCKNTSLK